MEVEFDAFALMDYPVEESRSLSVRIYRPGYELVEINAWNLTTQVRWKAADDLAGQEQALAGLFPQNILEPRSPEHKKALLFGASEYDRLATLAQEPEDKRRLLTAGQLLRNRAGE